MIHLAHQPGAIAVPPVVAGNFLVLAENNQAGDFTLRALAIQASSNGRPEATLKPVQQVPLRGRVSSPLAAQGQRVLAATARGMIYVYDLIGDKPEAPLVQVAEHTLTGPENENRFALLDGDCCWIADVQLAEYEIHAAEGRLTPKLITGQDSIFPQPPLVTGKTVFSVRCRNLAGHADLRPGRRHPERPLANQPGDAAGRRAIARGRREAHRGHRRGGHVSDHPAAAPQRRNCRSACANHSLGQIGAADQQRDRHERRHVCHDLRHRVEPDRALRSSAAAAIPLAHGASARYHDLSADSPGRRAARLCKSGRIFLLDPQSTGNLAEPFEPELKTDLAWNWRRPAAVGAREAVISDGDRRLYRLGIAANGDGRPHLSTQQEAKSPKAIASSLAVAGSVAYAVDDAGTLRSFELPSLAEGKTFKLPGGCTWGPQGVGNRVMLTTDNGQLICLDDRQNLLWQIDLTYGPLAGPPWAIAGQFILASQSGVVCAWMQPRARNWARSKRPLRWAPGQSPWATGSSSAATTAASMKSKCLDPKSSPKSPA